MMMTNRLSQIEIKWSIKSIIFIQHFVFSLIWFKSLLLEIFSIDGKKLKNHKILDIFKVMFLLIKKKIKFETP